MEIYGYKSKLSIWVWAIIGANGLYDILHNCSDIRQGGLLKHICNHGFWHIDFLGG